MANGKRHCPCSLARFQQRPETQAGVERFAVGLLVDLGLEPTQIDEGVAQLLGHQSGIASALEQVIQARQQFLSRGELSRQSCPDA